MSTPAAVSIHRHSANPKLWAVRSYLELISRDNSLVYGDGLKRLYVMTSGLSTYNEQDICDATAKAERMGVLPAGLRGFMVNCIIKNCDIYAQMLRTMINDRIVAIATGQVANPEPALKNSGEEARRYYYLPPFPFLQRVQKALRDDWGTHGRTVVTSLQDTASEAEFLMSQLQGSEGYITPQQSSFTALVNIVDRLILCIQEEQSSVYNEQDYRVRVRPALKIIWFIAKLLHGDLTVRPDNKDMAIVDLEKQLKFSDGTLAAIPFPTPETVSLFADGDVHGVSMKGRVYLAACSLAAFDRRDPNVVS